MPLRTPRWWPPLKRSIGAWTLLAGLLFQPASPIDKGALLVYDFDLGPVPARNVDHVASLGFDGLVTRCSIAGDVPKLAAYASHVASLENFRMLAYVDYDFQSSESPQVWRDALPILATLDAPLWVIVKNAPTSTDVNDLLLRMAQDAQLQGVPVVIYPHWNTDIETAADAAVRIAQVAHPNLYNALHTCHEIRGGNQYSMGAVVAAHVHDTRLVTIAGADDHAYTGPPPHSWDDAIKPLDRGTYSLIPFLQALDQTDYSGPIILHTWGLGNDPGHLSRSLEMYARYRANL